MSHRERCMAGVFSKILSQFGIVKDKRAPASASQTFLTELPSPTSSCTPPRTSHACGTLPPASNQNMHDCAHGNACNAGFNKDLSPAENGSTPSKAPTTGFRVRVSVPVYHETFAPVVVECTPGSGGVQGLQWYSEKLMMDEDGDVAQEFLDEVVSHASAGPHTGYTRMLPSFKIKMKTRPAKLKGPVCTYQGNVSQPVLI